MRTTSSSPTANAHLARVFGLQAHFMDTLQRVASAAGEPVEFSPTEWLRDDGVHGGGVRFGTGDHALFNRASMNVSHVHYDDLPGKSLASATALSCIIHPRNPHAPSIHLHASWTEMRQGPGYWRVMADLNPSVVWEEDRAAFDAAFGSDALAQHARAQGEKYFWIPALGRHRGVAHYYLEQHRTDDPHADAVFAEQFERQIIDTYGRILTRAVSRPWDDEAFRTQLAYHTLYLFQVLTLDRGTTSGLLVHDQNDLGILGSLPSHVDRGLLASWADEVEPIQRPLVQLLVDALPQGWPAFVSDRAKLEMVAGIRRYYREFPAALDLQARGDVVPPTVANHR